MSRLSEGGGFEEELFLGGAGALGGTETEVNQAAAFAMIERVKLGLERLPVARFIVDQPRHALAVKADLVRTGGGVGFTEQRLERLEGARWERGRIHAGRGRLPGAGWGRDRPCRAARGTGWSRPRGSEGHPVDPNSRRRVGRVPGSGSSGRGHRRGRTSPGLEPCARQRAGQPRYKCNSRPSIQGG